MATLLRYTAVLLIVLLLVPVAQTAPIPSGADSEVKDEAVEDADQTASVAKITADLFAHDEIALLLEEQGLSSEEVKTRLAQLSQQDLRYLSSNLDQVQAAGTVPDYIWILLAILLGVLILGALF